VRQGETRGGQSDDVQMTVYAAGFTHDLAAELFGSLDPERLNDAVLEGYNAKRDDLALAPILAGSYSEQRQRLRLQLRAAQTGKSSCIIRLKMPWMIWPLVKIQSPAGKSTHPEALFSHIRRMPVIFLGLSVA
jgi:hypothetical protein